MSIGDQQTFMALIGIVLLLTGLALAHLPVSECPRCTHCQALKGHRPPPRP